MKKIILLLICVLCLSGCTSNKFDYGKTITKDEFKNCFDIVNLDLSNWDQYFEFVEGEEPSDVQGRYDSYIYLQAKEGITENLCGYSSVDIEGQYQYRYKSDTYLQGSNVPFDSYTSSYDDYNNFYAYMSLTNGVVPEKNKAITSKFWSNGSYDTTPVEYQNSNEPFEKEVTSVEGNLCYANYPEDLWTSNSIGEKFFSFTSEDNNTVYTIFDNGLVRWEKGSGFGWVDYGDLYSMSYYSFFQE